MSFTTDCLLDHKEEMLLEAAREAANTCIKEGITIPEFENDDELIVWYEKAMDFERYEPDEDEGRPF